MIAWEAWLSLAVAGTLLVSLALRLAATDLLALTCLGILVVAQNVTHSKLLPTPNQAVAGFGKRCHGLEQRDRPHLPERVEGPAPPTLGQVDGPGREVDRHLMGETNLP